MKISIISFTQTGTELSKKIAMEVGKTENLEITLYTRHRDYAVETGGKDAVRFVEASVGEWAKKQMQEKNALLFIGACGIAVRAVAPYLTDKLHDVPVLVMDEKGRYVIPILSGHVGGANDLAVVLAKRIGAEPVITTATDLNGKFAVDVFAKRNGLSIGNKDGIARVSAKVLAGEEITMSIEEGYLEKEMFVPSEICMRAYPPKDAVDVAVTSEKEKVEAALTLVPKKYVIGLGCKKGKSEAEIDRFISEKLRELGIAKEEIWALASVSVKKDEAGILAWCRKADVPFFTYTAEELMETEGDFAASSFVQQQVGADNVCERAAVRACGEGGRLIAGKYAEDGMTIAVAKRVWRVRFEAE